MIHSPRLRGFSLVEVTIALGIAVFCLVAIFGLMTVGVNTSSASIEQTAAANLLPAVASDLRTAQPTSATYPKGSAISATPVYGLSIPAAGGSTTNKTEYVDASGAVVTQIAQARYKLTAQITSGTGRNATIAQVMLTWPPNASLANAAGTVETVVALDRN